MTIPTLVSWSGGKDSCLALWRAQQSGECVTHLLTALDETGLKARSHGVTRDLIISQGKSLGLTSEFISASWQDYEGQFSQKNLWLIVVIYGDFVRVNGGVCQLLQLIEPSSFNAHTSL